MTRLATSPEIRAAVLQDYIGTNESVVDIAWRYSLSVQTVHNIARSAGIVSRQGLTDFVTVPVAMPRHHLQRLTKAAAARHTSVSGLLARIGSVGAEDSVLLDNYLDDGVKTR